MLKKDMRDVLIGTLALGTAWGLGVLSCVYFEIKLLTEYRETITEERPERITYQRYYNSHREGS